MRSIATLERLVAEKNQLEKYTPNAKFYESKTDSFLEMKPDDVNTSGYWNLQGRRVIQGEKAIAYVVSGRGGKSPHGVVQHTRFIPAYHITQTEEL